MSLLALKFESSLDWNAERTPRIRALLMMSQKFATRYTAHAFAIVVLARQQVIPQLPDEMAVLHLLARLSLCLAG